MKKALILGLGLLLIITGSAGLETIEKEDLNLVKQTIEKGYFFTHTHNETGGNLLVGGIPINGYEDEQWKPIGELRSWKGTTPYQCRVAKTVPTDPGVECLDYNQTSITIRGVVGKLGFYPIRYMDEIEGELVERKRVNVLLDPLGRTYVLERADKIHIGENSTIIEIDSDANDTRMYTYDSTWNAVHDKAVSSISAGSEYTEGVGSYHFDALGRYYIYRMAWPFDTRPIPDGATIDSAVFSMLVSTITDEDDDGLDYIAIAGPTNFANPASPQGVDFDQCGAIDDPDLYSAEYDLGDLTDDVRNYMTLTDYTDIRDDEFTVICLREGHDIEDESIEDLLKNTLTMATGDTIYPAILNITYTAGAGAPSNAYECADSTNCEVNCTAYETLENSSDLGGNNITFIGSGIINVTANITGIDLLEWTTTCNWYMTTEGEFTWGPT